jgi:hypothetical protein
MEVRVATDRTCTQYGTVGNATSDTRGSIAIEIALWIGLLISESIELISRLTASHVLINTPRVKLPRERNFTSDGTVFIYIECASVNKHGLIAIKDGSVTDIR